MTPDETQKFRDLCTEIIAEKDKTRYLELVRQLDAIMEIKEHRLHDIAVASAAEKKQRA